MYRHSPLRRYGQRLSNQIERGKQELREEEKRENCYTKLLLSRNEVGSSIFAL